MRIYTQSSRTLYILHNVYYVELILKQYYWSSIYVIRGLDFPCLVSSLVNLHYTFVDEMNPEMSGGI